MTSDELQGRAVALVKQYGFFMPGPIKEFLRDMADFLKWDNLKGTLK